jgi:hypothetical protein
MYIDASEPRRLQPMVWVQLLTAWIDQGLVLCLDAQIRSSLFILARLTVELASFLCSLGQSVLPERRVFADI